MRGDVLKGHLDLMLLAVLAGEPAHGYAIMQALRDRSRGVFDIPEGTIYPALRRLEEGRLVSSRWTVAAGRKRRVYAITAAGKAAVRDRSIEWRTFAHAMNAVLKGA